MPTKKKSKADAEKDAPVDPREPIEPKPSALTDTLAELKALLAKIPEPEPIIEEPAEDDEDGAADAAQSGGGKSDAKSDGGKSNAKAEAKPETDAGSDGDDADDATGGDAGAEEGEAKKARGKKREPIVRLPSFDYVDALLHISFAHMLPCGYGQEVRRRIDESFVDRNEFRVTEAFEVEDLLQDLEIPDLFERCLTVRDSIAQIYNDQNGVSLAFLPEASISDRNMFFQRVPAVPDHAVHFLTTMVTIEEICFSDKSTLRAQQRLGLDPKKPGVSKFVDELRACLKPYGHVPLVVGPDGKNGKPNLDSPLSPACLLARLAPASRTRRR